MTEENKFPSLMDLTASEYILQLQLAQTGYSAHIRALGDAENQLLNLAAVPTDPGRPEGSLRIGKNPEGVEGGASVGTDALRLSALRKQGQNGGITSFDLEGRGGPLSFYGKEVRGDGLDSRYFGGSFNAGPFKLFADKNIENNARSRAVAKKLGASVSVPVGPGQLGGEITRESSEFRGNDGVFKDPPISSAKLNYQVPWRRGDLQLGADIFDIRNRGHGFEAGGSYELPVGEGGIFSLGGHYNKPLRGKPSWRAGVGFKTRF